MKSKDIAYTTINTKYMIMQYKDCSESGFEKQCVLHPTLLQTKK